MNLRIFEYLQALSGASSFSEAAAACGVSQPALSLQLRNAELELGVKLLERDRKGFLFTPCGEEVLARGRVILQQVQDVRQLAELWHDPYAGELSLGAIPTLAPYYLPQICDHLLDAYPNLHFNLVEEKTERLLEMLERGELDAAFLATPTAGKRFEHGLIFDERFLLGVSPRHRWAKRQTVTPAELAEEELLLLAEGHCLGEQSLSYCETLALSPVLDFRASSMETLLRMVQMGRGVSFVPACVARSTPWLHFVRIRDDGPIRRIDLVWRRTTVRRNLMLELVDDLQREAPGSESP